MLSVEERDRKDTGERRERERGKWSLKSAMSLPSLLGPNCMRVFFGASEMRKYARLSGGSGGFISSSSREGYLLEEIVVRR